MAIIGISGGYYSPYPYNSIQNSQPQGIAPDAQTSKGHTVPLPDEGRRVTLPGDTVTLSGEAKRQTVLPGQEDGEVKLLWKEAGRTRIPGEKQDIPLPGQEESKVELPGQEEDKVKLPGQEEEDSLQEEECESCKNRKYQDGSDQNVSFKSAQHISPESAAARVRAHEGEHVANAYTKAAKEGGKVVRASVIIHTDICDECGKVYVSGGTTNTTIRYSGADNMKEEPVNEES